MKRLQLSPEECVLNQGRATLAVEPVLHGKKKPDATHLRVRQARLRLASRQRRRANKITRNI
jgi:hypothetical protein